VISLHTTRVTVYCRRCPATVEYAVLSQDNGPGARGWGVWLGEWLCPACMDRYARPAEPTEQNQSPLVTRDPEGQWTVMGMRVADWPEPATA
jgi:hypothetical protein